MILDFTIRLGDILTLIALFGGGMSVILMQRADMRVIATRVGSVESSFSTFSSTVEKKLDGITEILVAQAKHDQRIAHVEDTLRMMQFTRAGGQTPPPQNN